MIVRKRTLILGFLLILGIAAAFVALRFRPVKPVIEMYDLTTAETPQMPMFYVVTDRKAVALTFDISWGEDIPCKVLDVLKERGQKATFFLSGPWSKHYKDVVKRIVDEGHEVASHGQDHDNLSQLSKEDIRDNIEDAHNILVNLTGSTPRFFRPPNGDYDKTVVQTANELGYETVIWAVDSLDWLKPGASAIVDECQNSSSVLSCCSTLRLGNGYPEALPMVLENLETAGYEIMPLGELLNLGKPARDDPRGRPLSELPR